MTYFATYFKYFVVFTDFLHFIHNLPILVLKSYHHLNIKVYVENAVLLLLTTVLYTKHNLKVKD